MTPAADDQLHAAVGAYALGVLDEDDAARFEEHLAGCERCGAELDELMGLPPVLAEFATAEDGAPAPYAERLVTPPGPELLDRLLDEVAATRRGRRTRRLLLAAAAAVLIVAGPFAGAALTSDDGGHSGYTASPAMEMYKHGEKHHATDPRTKVDATVSLENKPWGTHVALKLGNVHGPQKCALIAVGKDGEEETVTTWAVPEGGYGLKDGATKWSRQPLYAHGGAAMHRDDIARFDVRTLDGKRLASVEV